MRLESLQNLKTNSIVSGRAFRVIVVRRERPVDGVDLVERFPAVHAVHQVRSAHLGCRGLLAMVTPHLSANSRIESTVEGTYSRRKCPNPAGKTHGMK
jgi:hypothetical protein